MTRAFAPVPDATGTGIDPTENSMITHVQHAIRDARASIREAYGRLERIDPYHMDEDTRAARDRTAAALRDESRRLARLVNDPEPFIEYRNVETGEITEQRDLREAWTDAGFEVDERSAGTDVWQPSNYEAGYDYERNRSREQPAPDATETPP